MTKDRLRSIAYVENGLYDVVFGDDSSTMSVRCKVSERGGVKGGQPEPDVFMAGLVMFPREVCATVLAFDHVVREESAAQAP